MTASDTSRIAPLLTPLQLRGLTLPNRIAMAPMTRSRSPGGIPTEGMAAYYQRRAEGETSLILTEGVAVPHNAAIGFSGVDVPDIPYLYGDVALAEWKKIVDAIHDAGGLVAPQLWHQGGMRTPGTGAWPEAESMRPSGLWGPLGRFTTVPSAYVEGVAAETRPMTEEEIADIVHAFAIAASNAKKIGFDAIALHGGHGYLIDAFWWRETNLRTDKWGGEPKRRGAFAGELVRAVREAIGPSMPIILRFSQWKQQDYDGRIAEHPDELGDLLGPAVDAGVDLLDVSARNFDTPAFEGSELSLAGWARKVTGCKSMACGSIGLSKSMYDSHATGGAAALDNIDALMRRFEAEEFDAIAVGRMMIAHADWARRMRLGLPMIQHYDRSLLKELI